MTTRCHSVRSLRSPETRSRHDSEVARFRLAMRIPSWVERISGSRPRLPTSITLLTLPAMRAIPLVRGSRGHFTKPGECSYFILIHTIHSDDADHWSVNEIRLPLLLASKIWLSP